MIDATQFKNADEVVLVTPPAEDGSYKCPICEEVSPDRRMFGLHLSHAHKIRSATYETNKKYYQERRQEKAAKESQSQPEKPSKKKQPPEQLTNRIIKYCPNCGFNLELHEAAAEVITRGR